MKDSSCLVKLDRLIMYSLNKLKITVLVENTAGGKGLLGEHGLSFLIEADEKRILFDTGQGLALNHNAGILNISLDNLDAIVLSHGHYDHAEDYQPY